MANILITGASSGLGAEFARQYAATGTTLFLSGRDAERLQYVSEDCRQKGAVVHHKVIDVSQREAMQDWISDIYAVLPISGGLDLIIANAGISAGVSGQALDDIQNDYKIFDINLMGVLNTIYPALPYMTARRSGHIVMISSMAGFLPMPSAPAYSASKAAVRFYGEALRSKLAAFDIAVTVICPGFVKSRITDQNDFHMPFLMETDVAVRCMIEKIAKRVPRMAFPWPITITLKLLSLLPARLSSAIFACLPDKNSLQKD